MDISCRLMANNVIASVVVGLYFVSQMISGVTSIALSFIFIPLAKIAIDRLIRQVEMRGSTRYPLSELGVNLIRDQYGVWLVIIMEFIRRILSVGSVNGCLAIVLMVISLICYIFSLSTGSCITNTRIFKRGTIAYTLATWFLFVISFLVGSSWVIAI